jgi:Domain of unknown function (DUF4234)
LEAAESRPPEGVKGQLPGGRDGQAPAGPTRLEAFPLLDGDSRKRLESDVRLSFAMYLVLGWLTLGVYAWYIHYKLMARQQDHFRRMGRFVADLLKVVEERAELVGKTEECRSDLYELRGLNDSFQRLNQQSQHSSALWLILSIATLGIASLYPLYFLNKDLQRHQAAEAEYVDKASMLLTKLGVGRHAVVAEQVAPDRSYPLYVVLSIVTLGVFGYYWLYALIKDGNDHFAENDRFEDQLLATIRSAA